MELKDLQPAITVKHGDTVNVMSVVDLRRLANGAEYCADKDHLISVLSRAVVDLIE